MPSTLVQTRVLPLWALLFTIVGSNVVASADGIDPQNDTYGSPSTIHDIANFEANVSSVAINFAVEFYNPVAAPSAFAANSIVGFIDIDIDQNPLTGALAKKSVFSPNGDSGLGTEFHIDLFSERFHVGEAEIVDTSTFQSVGMASITYGATSMNVRVPLDLLEGDTLFNYGIIVGDFLDISDEAPNDGFATSVPEPSGASYLLMVLVLCIMKVRD